MGRRDDRSEVSDASVLLVKELLRTGLALGGVLGTLLEEMPEDAFPGEDNAAVLLEMVVGSARPATEAAGPQGCAAAAALIGAIGDRIVDDLRDAAALAGRINDSA